MSNREQKKAAFLAEVEKNMGGAYAQLDAATTEKMADVFTDEEFLKKLFSLEEPEEVQAAFKEKGLHYTLEEIMGMRDFLVNAPQENGELSDEQMEQVGGGILYAAAKGYLSGLVGGFLGAAVEDAYKAFKKKTGFKW